MSILSIGTIGNQLYNGSEIILTQGDYVNSPIPWDTCVNNSLSSYGLYRNIISVSNVNLMNITSDYTFYFYGCIPPQMYCGIHSDDYDAQYILGYSISGTTSTENIEFYINKSEDEGTTWGRTGGTVCTFTRGTFSASYLGTNLWDNVFYSSPSNPVYPILLRVNLRNTRGTNTIILDQLNVFYKLQLTPKTVT